MAFRHVMRMRRSLSALVLLTFVLAVGCSNDGGSESVTTAPIQEWSNAEFGDVVAFCQDSGGGPECAAMTRAARDLLGCTVEGAFLVIGEYLVVDEMRGGLLFSTRTADGPPEYPDAPWADGMEIEEARAVLQDRLDGAYRAGECSARFHLFSDEGAYLGFPLPSE